MGGHIEFEKMVYTNPCPLTETLDETLTSDHLNRVEYVSIVIDSFDGAKKKKIIYFLDDWTTRVIFMEDLLINCTKELKYIHYLLRVTNSLSKLWSIIILSTIRNRIMDGGNTYSSEYIPSYNDLLKNENLIKKKSTMIKEFQGEKQSDLNPRGSMLTYLGLAEDRFYLSSVRRGSFISI